MSDIEVRELKKDEYNIWDNLVESSPHGTIFHKSFWLSMCSEMKTNNVRSIYLYVDKENLPVIKLYKTKGFEVIGKLKNICGEGKDCYKMELKLKTYSRFANEY